MTGTSLIAQIVPSGLTVSNIYVDFAHSRIYMTNFETKLWSYEIPTPLATVPILNGPTDNPDTDGEIGFITTDSTANILLEAAGFPRETVYKIDPVTFASLGTFGVSAIFGSYPTGFAQSTAAACVTVNSVPYLVVKELGIGNPNAGVIRTDNMTASGWYGSVSTGDQGDSFICSGKSGATGTVFFADAHSSSHSSMGVYVMTILTGAETYNIASWPTENPDISVALLATINATDIDPSWTSIQAQSLGYDAGDDLVLLYLTQQSDSSSNYLTALNATTGAIVWSNLLPSNTSMTLQQTRANKGQIATIGNGGSTWLDGYNGGLSLTVNGLGTVGRLYSSDDVNQYIVTLATYTQDTDTPQPVDADTPSSFAGWAILAGTDIWPFSAPPPSTTKMGLTDLVVTQQTSTTPRDVSLRWSDDGGASYSNPVDRTLGDVGDYFTSPTWWRLGMSRSRIFEVSWSGAISGALTGVFVRYEILGT